MCFTRRQVEIIQFIQEYRSVRRISPTMDEIAIRLGVTKVTVLEHLNQLERKGAIRRPKFQKRAIELLVKLPDRPDRFTMPLLGAIQAGAPLQSAIEEKRLDLTTVLPLEKNCFALRVVGDSMIEDQIRDGDYVIVEARQSARNGDTVVAVLPDGRATLKRYYRERFRIRLQPANGAFRPTYARQVQIRGVVIGLLRNFNPERN
jgi:repressor LexA